METVHSRQTQQLYWASWWWNNVGLPVALPDRPGIREMAGNAERKTHQEKGGVVSFAKHRATRERSASCFKTPCTIVSYIRKLGHSRLCSVCYRMYWPGTTGRSIIHPSVERRAVDLEDGRTPWLGKDRQTCSAVHRRIKQRSAGQRRTGAQAGPRSLATNRSAVRE